MLADFPVLKEQEVKGNYEFLNVRMVCTPGFMHTFGDETYELCSVSQKLILTQHPNADYLQVFEYQNHTYWCISDFEKGYKAEDYVNTPYLYITFLLPDEY